MYKEGQNQFVPFVVTIVAIVFTDLLKGIGIGLVVGLGYVLYTNFRSAISVLKDEKSTIIKFNKDIFFYNRANLVRALAAIKSGETVYIDASQADFIDYDIYMTIQDFEQNAKQNNIKLEENGISRRKINYRKKNENIPKTTIS
jgi:carbonic anhydrase